LENLKYSLVSNTKNIFKRGEQMEDRTGWVVLAVVLVVALVAVVLLVQSGTLAGKAVDDVTGMQMMSRSSSGGQRAFAQQYGMAPPKRGGGGGGGFGGALPGGGPSGCACPKGPKCPPVGNCGTPPNCRPCTKFAIRNPTVGVGQPSSLMCYTC